MRCITAPYPKIQSKVNNQKAPSKAEVYLVPKLQFFTPFLRGGEKKKKSFWGVTSTAGYYWRLTGTIWECPHTSGSWAQQWDSPGREKVIRLSPQALVPAFTSSEFVQSNGRAALRWTSLLWFIMANIQVQMLISIQLETYQTTSSSTSEESNCAQSY